MRRGKYLRSREELITVTRFDPDQDADLEESPELYIKVAENIKGIIVKRREKVIINNTIVTEDRFYCHIKPRNRNIRVGDFVDRNPSAGLNQALIIMDVDPPPEIDAGLKITRLIMTNADKSGSGSGNYPYN